MTGQGGESMQVVYMEIEGIKIAIQLAKDALNIAWQLSKFLMCSLNDAKYKRSVGKTNIKNMAARANANGQSLIPVSMDIETYNNFKKDAAKYGVLYHAFKPLKSGKDGCVQVVIFEKDIPMVQEILARAKEKKIRENVKNGMEEEAAAREFEEDNHVETMDEFAENVGATSETEVFESEMKEQFGEDYEKQLVPNGETAGMDPKKVDKLAEVINFEERAKKLQGGVAEVNFIYDEKNGKSQIVEETETHVKVVQKEPSEDGTRMEQRCIWLPKDAIVPPLNQDAGENGIRTAKLQKGVDVVIEHPTGKEKLVSVKAENMQHREERGMGTFVAEDTNYKASAPQKPEGYDITISNNLVKERTDRAVKTRVPGTWGEDARYLWMSKKDIISVYNGASMLFTLKKDKDYKLYSADDKVLELIKGEQLYKEHYDSVPEWVRKKAQKDPASGSNRVKGKGRSI